MALCIDRAAIAVPSILPGHPSRIRNFQPPVAPDFASRRNHFVVAANSPCTGWEGRLAFGHGDIPKNGPRDRGVVASMAVAPSTSSSSEAAGVTESGNFSQSDEELASRGLACHSTLDDLDLDQLNSLFAKVSFPQREKQKLLRALQNTQAMTWVQETESKRLIGFARATGDRVFHAIIWDVVVDPAYQGLGLGKVLMERLMADLVAMGISNIALYAEPTVVGFYQPLGFIADPDGIRAMAYSRRK